MPVEGGWQRAHTPLSRREKGVLVSVGALIAAAAIAFGAVELTRGPTQAGCVTADVPSTMGGVRIHECGAKARELCRTQSGIDAAVAQACRLEGYATGSP